MLTIKEIKGVQVEGYELNFMQVNDRFKATLKARKGVSVFVRAYLIKKGQFNSIVTLKNKVTHGSVIISMDKLKSTRIVITLTNIIGGCQSVILNECSPEGAIIRLGDHDRIPMYTITMPPLFPYKPTAPDIEYLKGIFIGLIEAFPSYSQDFFR
jgi:hypothetical protein